MKQKDKLMTVANYARLKKVAVITVYRWGKAGDIQIVEIDGVKFVKVEE